MLAPMLAAELGRVLDPVGCGFDDHERDVFCSSHTSCIYRFNITRRGVRDDENCEGDPEAV